MIPNKVYLVGFGLMAAAILYDVWVGREAERRGNIRRFWHSILIVGLMAAMGIVDVVVGIIGK